MIWPFTSTVNTSDKIFDEQPTEQKAVLEQFHTDNVSNTSTIDNQPSREQSVFHLWSDDALENDIMSTVPEKPLPSTLCTFDSLYGITKTGNLMTLAARKELFEIVSLLVTEDSIHTVDSKGNTLLHNAAFHGDIRMCKRLLGLGASLNVVNKSGNTPIHRAINGKHPETALLLVKYELARRRVTPFRILTESSSEQDDIISYTTNRVSCPSCGLSSECWTAGSICKIEHKCFSCGTCLSQHSEQH